MAGITRIWNALLSRARNLLLRCRGMRIEGYCWLQAIEVPRNADCIGLGRGVALDRGVTLLVSPKAGEIRKMILQVGESSYINRHSILDASEKIGIGARCLIGPFCYITDHDHGPESDRSELICQPTLIEDDCWIGAHVTILKGVTIGRGSTIGAGSVVTRSIPAGAVAMGNPARVRE